MPTASDREPDVPASAPTAGAPEPPRVRAMFDRIAGRYDLLNHVMSMQLDRLWRRRAARLATRGLDAPRILDLCTGTADLLLAHRRAAPGARVFGGDFSLEMLRLAATKAPHSPFSAVDALRLPFRDRSFDVVSVAFGVRNLADRHRGFEEIRRVLRPGGRCVVLECTPPPDNLVGAALGLYSNHVLPRVAAVLSRDKDAYRYLPDSVKEFPDAEALAAEMERAGYEEVTHERLTFGTVAIHVGRSPA